MNGVWLLILLGRWSMFTGWVELLTRQPMQGKREFVSVDALGGPYDLKMNDPRSYEMLGRDKDGMVTPEAVREGPIYPPLRSYLASTDSPTANTPTGFAADGSIDGGHSAAASPSPSALAGGAANAPPSGTNGGRRTPDYFGQTARYNPPERSFSSPRPPTRDGQASMTSWGDASASSPGHGYHQQQQHHQHSSPVRPYSPPTTQHYHQQNAYSDDHEGMNPLGMNRI